jgi:hypothetical protein
MSFTGNVLEENVLHKIRSSFAASREVEYFVKKSNVIIRRGKDRTEDFIIRFQSLPFSSDTYLY